MALIDRLGADRAVHLREGLADQAVHLGGGENPSNGNARLMHRSTVTSADLRISVALDGGSSFREYGDCC